MKRRAALAALLVACGCEALVSDAATRIRHQVRDAAEELAASTRSSRVLTLLPTGWPGGCPDGGRYRVRLVPYRGGKQVAAADVFVKCVGGREYSTGTRLIVAREMAVEKAPGEAVRITLRKAPAGIEIAAIE